MFPPRTPPLPGRSPSNFKPSNTTAKSTESARRLPRVKDAVTDVFVFLPAMLTSESLEPCRVRWSASAVSSVNRLKNAPVSTSMFSGVPSISAGANTRPLLPIFMSRLVRIVSGGQALSASAGAAAPAAIRSPAVRAILRMFFPLKPVRDTSARPACRCRAARDAAIFP